MEKLRPEFASLITFSPFALPREQPGKGRPKAVNRVRREQLATRVDQIVDEVRVSLVLLFWDVLWRYVTIFLAENGR